MNKERFAKIVSFAMHPIVFALLVPFLVIYKQSASLLYGLKWTFFCSFFLFLVMAGLFFVRKKEFLSDIDISDKDQRHIFYSIATLAGILFFIAALIFKGVFFPLSVVSLGIVLGVVIFDLINYYMKISIHAAIVCAYIITFGMLYGFWPFVAVSWILPLVAWSRLYLKKHTKMELIVGALAGACITLATFLIGKLLILT